MSQPETLTYFAPGTGDVLVNEAALRSMAKTRPWAIGCAVAMFLYALVGGALAAWWLFVAISRGGEPDVGLTEFVIVIPPNLIGSPLAATGGWLALRYHTAVGRALVRRNPEDLERALAAQLHIWRWAGITVLALFAMPPIIVVTGWLVGIGR